MILTISARALITFPRVVRLLLMLAPSFNRVPFAPVESALSDPAKSTSDILLTFSVIKPVILSCCCCVKNIVKTACDLLDVSFMLVAATVLEYIFNNTYCIQCYKNFCKILVTKHETNLALLPSSMRS